MSQMATPLSRRGWLGASAAGSLFGAGLFAGARAAPAAGRISPATNTSFASLKQIDAGVLSIGYAEAGPSDGPAVILLHGWPYDIQSYVDVAPLLTPAGYRVIVPYVRGCGATRFLSDATFRNGQQAAVALDAIAMMDALKIRSEERRVGKEC